MTVSGDRGKREEGSQGIQGKIIAVCVFVREKYVSGCVGVDKSSCLFVCSVCVCTCCRSAGLFGC